MLLSTVNIHLENFVRKKCSKAYSTKDKRIEINKKVSNKLSKGIVEKNMCLL